MSSIDARVKTALSRAAATIRSLRAEKEALTSENVRLRLLVEEQSKTACKAENQRLQDEIASLRAELDSTRKASCVKRRATSRKRKTPPPTPNENAGGDRGKCGWNAQKKLLNTSEHDREIDDALNSIFAHCDDHISETCSHIEMTSNDSVVIGAEDRDHGFGSATIEFMDPVRSGLPPERAGTRSPSALSMAGRDGRHDVDVQSDQATEVPSVTATEASIDMHKTPAPAVESFAISPASQSVNTCAFQAQSMTEIESVESCDAFRVPAMREMRCDAEYMRNLNHRLHSQFMTDCLAALPKSRKGRLTSKTKVDRQTAFAHARRALSATRKGGVAHLAAALSVICYGTTVHYPPFRVRKQSPYRGKIQSACANEKWSARHIVVELLAWFSVEVCDGESSIDYLTTTIADVIVQLASPTHLGRDTVFVALHDIAQASLSWEAWGAALSEHSKRQLDEAVTHHRMSRVRDPVASIDLPSEEIALEPASGKEMCETCEGSRRLSLPILAMSESESSDEEGSLLPVPSHGIEHQQRGSAIVDGVRIFEPEVAMRALLSALCDRLGCGAQAGHILKEATRLNCIGKSDGLGAESSSDEFRMLLARGATSVRSLLDDMDRIGPTTIGLVAWLIVRENPLDTAVGRAREYLQIRLGSPEAAAALLAAHSGESNDGACQAVIEWARALPAAMRAALPRRLLRRIAQTCRRPKARCINLASATARRVAMARLALIHGVDMERCEAVDNAAAPAASIPESTVATTWSKMLCEVNAEFDQSSRGLEYKNSNGVTLPELSPTERACAASHVQQWCRAKRDDAPVIIFEDDVTLTPGFARKARKALEIVPDDFDILLLGYFFPGGEIERLKREPVAVLRHFIMPTYFWGLHAYVLSCKGAAKLLRHLPVDGPADVFVAGLVNDGTLTAYAAKTKLAKLRTASTLSIARNEQVQAGLTCDQAAGTMPELFDDGTRHIL